jgi:hypothetical protein
LFKIQILHGSLTALEKERWLSRRYDLEATMRLYDRPMEELDEIAGIVNKTIQHRDGEMEKDLSNPVKEHSDNG